MKIEIIKKQTSFVKEFDCGDCKCFDMCRDSGYKINCMLFAELQAKFQRIYQLRNAATNEPRAIRIVLDNNGKQSFDIWPKHKYQARDIINKDTGKFALQKTK